MPPPTSEAAPPPVDEPVPAPTSDVAPPPVPEGPPTPEQTAVEVDRIPLDALPPEPPGAGADAGDTAAGLLDVLTPDTGRIVPDSSAGLTELITRGSFSSSADISSSDPSAADLGEAFLDPAIPAAGVGVLDESGGGDPLGDLAREIVEAAGDALAAVARLWADPPSPGLGTVGADGVADPSAAVGLLTGSLAWYSGVVAVLAVLIAGGRMVWQRRTQPLADLMRGLGTLVLVSGAGLTGVILLVSASDAFSVWILEQATGDVETGLTDLLAVQQSDDMSVVLTVLLGTATLLAAVVQVVLLVARGVVLVVLAGVLPLTASATNTDTGRAVFVRTLTWTAAFALYQPAAALVYAAAFLTPLPEDSPLVAALTGTTFLVLAIAALPVLLKVLQPMVRTVSSTSRVRAAVSGLPSGARAVAPVTLAAGSAGSSSSMRVPSARGAAPRPTPAALTWDGARVGATRLTTGVPALDGLPGADRVPVPAHGRHSRRAGRQATETPALPASRPDGEDLVP
ncbi:hypothetical protein [Geodermatophilus sabuli]|uniref:hypothetical protein n=1 Tax=Geodermatophilus sabuli TaxID=1564158 RepID=UPI001952A509|nr:hypothetical protein [Geodermatophilus sabuli]